MISKRLRELRLSAGLTMEKASRKINLCMSHLSRLEGGSDFTVTTLRRLAEGYARVLGQDPRQVLAYLVFGDEEAERA